LAQLQKLLVLALQQEKIGFAADYRQPLLVAHGK